MLVVLVACVFLSPVFVFAHSLAWDRTNAEPDLAGYNAYDVTTTRVKMNTTVIPDTICTGTIPGGICVTPIPTQYHIEGHRYVVTAIDTAGNESIDSNIAGPLNTIAPGAPGSGSLHIINP